MGASLKLIIDDGSAWGNPLPTLRPEVTAAIVAEAHRLDTLAVAHIMSHQGARQAINAASTGWCMCSWTPTPTPPPSRRSPTLGCSSPLR